MIFKRQQPLLLLLLQIAIFLSSLLPIWNQLHLVASQTVELFVGELNGNVYVEWCGNLTYLYQAMPLDSTGTPVQLAADGFVWAALSTPEYSFMTGSPDVTYMFVSPGIFNLVPDMVMGDPIGLTGGTTVFIPLDYEMNLGAPIKGCMLFESATMASLGIIDGVTSSVSWNDPSGVEPEQSIVMNTDSTHFPPGYADCFPSPAPSESPTMAPSVSMVPTPLVTLAPSTAAVGGGAPAVIVGAIAAVGAAGLAGIAGAGAAAVTREVLCDEGGGKGKKGKKGDNDCLEGKGGKRRTRKLQRGLQKQPMERITRSNNIPSNKRQRRMRFRGSSSTTATATRRAYTKSIATP